MLSTFIHKNDWMIAISYSIGGSLGAYIVSLATEKEKKAKEKK